MERRTQHNIICIHTFKKKLNIVCAKEKYAKYKALWWKYILCQTVYLCVLKFIHVAHGMGKQTNSYLKIVGFARFENRKNICYVFISNFMRPCIFALGWRDRIVFFFLSSFVSGAALFLLLSSIFFFLLFLWIDTIAIEPYGSWIIFAVAAALLVFVVHFHLHCLAVQTVKKK